MAVWIAVSGGKKVGKTSVIEQIIEHLTPLGYRVATIKHTSHQVDLDTPGADTSRHRQAGADIVALNSPKGWFVMMEPTEDRCPEPLAVLLSTNDVVLCEGYYHADMAKIMIVSNILDDKTAQEPTGNIILNARLKKNQQGQLHLSDQDLAQVISYIQSQSSTDQEQRIKK